MSRMKYKSDGGPKRNSRRMPDRPSNPNPGHVIRDSVGTFVYTGRDWAFFPQTALELSRFARLHRWGVRFEITPVYSEAGYNAEGDKLIRTEVKIVLLIGREVGETLKGRQSKAYQYRLMWDTSRNGIFEMRSWHRRTSTDPTWHEIGSIAEIRPIIAQNPVLPERTETNE